MDEETIKDNVEIALRELIKNDRILLILDANERSITHMLALYLREKFWPEYDVDCEYNRNLIQTNDTKWYRDLPKRIELKKDRPELDDTNGKTVFPDIIIHKRGKKENLLVIEVKKTTSQENGDFDHKKLEEYMCYDRLEYKYSLFICIKTLKQNEIEKIVTGGTYKIGIEHAEYGKRKNSKTKMCEFLIDVDCKILKALLGESIC